MSIGNHEIGEAMDDVGEILSDLRFRLKHKLSDGKYYSSRHSDETWQKKIQMMFDLIEL